ncbi:MAG: cytochrome c biogenesis protein CcsA [Planctomycetota bacterium]
MGVQPLEWIDLGERALEWLAIPMVIFAMLCLLTGIVWRDAGIVAAGRRTFYATAAAITVAIGSLAAAFLGKGAYDVSFVYAHSDPTQQWFFLLAGCWAGQEGSLLFWNFVLSLFGAALAFAWRKRNDRTSAITFVVFAVVQLYFLCVVVLLEQNPFEKFPTDQLADNMVAINDGTSVRVARQAVEWLNSSIVPGTVGRIGSTNQGLTFAQAASTMRPNLMAELRDLKTANLPERYSVQELAKLVVEGTHQHGLSVMEVGAGLNPLLANYWIAIHPPCMYTGLIGCAVIFAIAIGGLLGGRIDRWARDVRPWLLFTWMFLSIGNILGGLWAYEELGWGGFWDWDPVENAAYVPWLVATALLHTIIAQERRRVFRVLNPLLAALTFGLTIWSTWVTRSGAINSIHAFAEGPMIGRLLFSGIGVVLAVTTMLVVWRLPMLLGRVPAPDDPDAREPGKLESLGGRETLMLGGAVTLLTLMVFVVGLTMWPLLSWRMTGDSMGMRWAYFITMPFFVLMFMLMGLAMALPWRRPKEGEAKQRLMVPVMVGVLVTAVTGILQLVCSRTLGIGAAQEALTDLKPLFNVAGEVFFQALLIGAGIGVVGVIIGLAVSSFVDLKAMRRPRNIAIAVAGVLFVALAIAAAVARGDISFAVSGAQTSISTVVSILTPPLVWGTAVFAAISLYVEFHIPASARAKAAGKPAPVTATSVTPVTSTATPTPAASSPPWIVRYVLAFPKVLFSNRRRYGGYIAHIGALMLFIGICAATMFKTQQEIGNIPLGGAVAYEAGFPVPGTFTWTLRRYEAGARVGIDHAYADRVAAETGAELPAGAVVVREPEKMTATYNRPQIEPGGEMPVVIVEAPGALGDKGQVRDATFDMQVANLFVLSPGSDAARVYMPANRAELMKLLEPGRIGRELTYLYTRAWLELRIDAPEVTLDVSGLIASGGSTSLSITTEAGTTVVPISATGSRPAQTIATQISRALVPLGIAVRVVEATGRILMIPTGVARSLAPTATTRPGFMEVSGTGDGVAVVGAKRAEVVPAVALATPTLRRYRQTNANGEPQTTREAHILQRWSADEFVVPAAFMMPPDGSAPGTPGVTAFVFHHNPLMVWNLWGAVILVIGTVICLWPPRRRDA